MFSSYRDWPLLTMILEVWTKIYQPGVIWCYDVSLVAWVWPLSGCLNEVWFVLRTHDLQKHGVAVKSVCSEVITHKHWRNPHKRRICHLEDFGCVMSFLFSWLCHTLGHSVVFSSVVFSDYLHLYLPPLCVYLTIAWQFVHIMQEWVMQINCFCLEHSHCYCK